MADTAYPIRGRLTRNKRTINDIGDQAAQTNKPSENRNRAMRLLELASKIGMAYRSNGEPNSSPIAAGAMCLDYANDDIYVCTDRSTPTWTALAE